VRRFRILRTFLSLMMGLLLVDARASEWTHGVETEAGSKWKFHFGGGVESHSFLGAPSVVELPGFRRGWEGGARWGAYLQGFISRQEQTQEFWFDGLTPFYRSSGRVWTLGGRVFPFGRTAGLEPFLSGGFHWISGTLETPGYQSRWEGREGFGGAGLWYSWERLLSAWLDFRFHSGDKGSDSNTVPGSPVAWDSALNLSRSASWSVGAGVGIYF
jgi:hypothetical protein